MTISLDSQLIGAIIALLGAILAVLIPIAVHRSKKRRETRRTVANSFWLGHEISTVLLARYAQVTTLTHTPEKAKHETIFSNDFAAHLGVHCDIVSSRVNELNLGKNVSDKVSAMLIEKLDTTDSEAGLCSKIKHLTSAEIELRLGQTAKDAFVFAIDCGFLMGAIISMGSQFPAEALSRLTLLAQSLGLPSKGLVESTDFESLDKYLRQCGQRLQT